MTDQKEMKQQKELDAKDLDKVVGGSAAPETDHVCRNLLVNNEICTCCGICESECPTGAILFLGDSYYIIGGDCVACCRCVDVCPTGAIRVL